MNLPGCITRGCIVLLMTGSLVFAQAPAKPAPVFPPELVKTGESSFVQQCAFCHGRDTGGGEDGPDLTRSKLVAEDVEGNQIGPVVRNGRNKMPRFTVTDGELAALAAFIHTRKSIGASLSGRHGDHTGSAPRPSPAATAPRARIISTEGANATTVSPPPAASR